MPGAVLAAEDILEHLRPRVARWWLPDEIRFIDEVPKTSTGKFSKKTLREQLYPAASDTHPTAGGGRRA
jgi:fatty-acyl-CoA synthase